MSDSPETIQQQMEITKLQITEKFGVLESQMASSLESTGNAVSASAEAVHETVQTNRVSQNTFDDRSSLLRNLAVLPM